MVRGAGGRPLKFKTVEGLQIKIDKYFDSLVKVKWVDEKQRDDKTGELLKDSNGKYIIKPIRYYYDDPLPTVTGLALGLDTSRETLMNYQDKGEYFATIKKAKDRVQASYEQTMRKSGKAGDIFALKNFGWTDKQEIDHTIKGDSLSDVLTKAKDSSK